MLEKHATRCIEFTDSCGVNTSAGMCLSCQLDITDNGGGKTHKMGFEKLVWDSLITFYVIMNDVPLVFSLVSLIYRKATKLCILVVYPNTLSKAFMVLRFL